jgi:hypothetical protein
MGSPIPPDDACILPILKKRGGDQEEDPRKRPGREQLQPAKQHTTQYARNPMEPDRIRPPLSTRVADYGSRARLLHIVPLVLRPGLAVIPCSPRPSGVSNMPPGPMNTAFSLAPLLSGRALPCRCRCQPLSHAVVVGLGAWLISIVSIDRREGFDFPLVEIMPNDGQVGKAAGDGRGDC